jgi:hypothetical protein
VQFRDQGDKDLAQAAARMGPENAVARPCAVWAGHGMVHDSVAGAVGGGNLVGVCGTGPQSGPATKLAI